MNPKRRTLRTAPRMLTSPTARRLPQALLTGIGVEIGLRVVRLPTLVGLLGVSLDTGTETRQVSATPSRLGNQDGCRYRAACHVLRLWPDGGENSCLRLALVAGFLLRHRKPTLHLGAARVSGQTRAHAWISVDGMVFDGVAGTYRPLTKPAG